MATSEKQRPELTVYFKGSCACNRLTYTCSSLPTNSNACHCTTCRKLSGGPYQAWVDAESKDITFYDDKEKLKYEGLPKDSIGGLTFLNFSKVGERAFCADCHSPLAMRYRHEPHVVALALGTVDEESLVGEEVREKLRPRQHIFVGQKAWWVDVERDGVPCYDRFHGEYEEEMRAWGGKEG